MACSNPFPLSNSDAQAFTNDLGDYFDDIAPWGAMFAWKGRLILVAIKADGTLAFSDISGGIPWVQAQGGCIPASIYLAAFGRGEYISPTEAFFMALPANFMQVAKEDFDAAIAAGKYVINAAGEVVNAVTGGIIDPIVKPVTDILWPLAIVAGVILAVMYLPKGRKENYGSF
jgi:hypothetical protein